MTTGKKNSKGRARDGLGRFARRVSDLGTGFLGEPLTERTRKFAGEVKRGAKKVSSDLQEAGSNLGRAKKNVKKAGTDLRTALSRATTVAAGREKKAGSVGQTRFGEKGKSGKSPFGEKVGRSTRQAATKAATKASSTGRSLGNGKAARVARAQPFSAKEDGKARGEPFSERAGKGNGKLQAAGGGTAARGSNGRHAVSANGAARPARPQPEHIPATKPHPSKKKGPAAKASGRMTIPGSSGHETRGG